MFLYIYVWLYAENVVDLTKFVTANYFGIDGFNIVYNFNFEHENREE